MSNIPKKITIILLFATHIGQVSCGDMRNTFPMCVVGSVVGV